jgi:FAD dependent oxidoreductase
VLHGFGPVAAFVRNDRVESVTVRSSTDVECELRGRYVIDATELGELLPLTGAEHVTGFESRHDTGEPSAPDQAQPANMQAFSWCFAIERRAGQDHTIDMPAQYGYWRGFRPPGWPGRLLSLVAPHPHPNQPVARTMVPNPAPRLVVADPRLGGGDLDMWVFRRLLCRDVLADGFLDSDIVLINWPVIDYVGGPLIGVTEAQAGEHLHAARQLSLSFRYWMQTELPRPDGGTGWPGLRLRGHVLGSDDGLALAPISANRGRSGRATRSPSRMSPSPCAARVVRCATPRRFHGFCARPGHLSGPDAVA